MRRKIRKNFNKEDETKKMVYISASILVLVVLAFVITFLIYSNILKNDAKTDISKTNPIFELASNNKEDVSQASSQMDKTVNEVQNDNNIINNITQEDISKVAINTSKMEKENTNTIVTSTTVKEEKKEKIPDPTFIKPVEGEIIREFASDKLVYSNTLREWITHNGIDIQAEKTTIVKASADGNIKSIKNDPRYGITVVIEHTNGYQTVYSNLLTAEFIKEDENVKQGQTIGTVGNTAAFEIADEYHLHFELVKNGLYLDPNLYIK